jgi:hypothetical protein
MVQVTACAITKTKNHRIIENPPPYPRLRRRGPASDVVFTPSKPARRASREPMGCPGEPHQQADAVATERDISRRLLQSETAHEHNHEPSESRSRSPTSRAQLALSSEETSWRGWGPVRLVDDSFQVASWLPPSPSRVAAARTKTFTRHLPRFHEPGGGALANEQCCRSPPGEACPKTEHRALCWHTHARGSLSQARSARAPPVTVPLRSRLESPRSAIVNHKRRGAAWRRSKRFRLAHPGFRGSRTIHENPMLRAHVRCACAHRPPRAAVPDCCQPFTGAACEPNITVGSSLSRVTPARSARLGGRAAHASRLPRGLGLASPGRSAKSDRDRQCPRCFPSLATCLTIRAYVQSRRAGRVLSTASHQPVERARCLFRPSSGTAALTGFRQRERGLPCDQDEPKLSWTTGRWLPTRLPSALDL